MRARKDGGGDGGGGAPVALGRRPPGQGVPHEGLAGRPDEQRAAERGRQLGQPRQHTITVRRPFGKPNTWVDDQPLWRHTSLNRALDAVPQLGGDLGDHIPVHRLGIHRRRTPPRVHENQGRARVGDGGGQRRILPESGDIVHDCGAGGDGRARDARLVGIDGDGNGQASAQRLELLGKSDGLGVEELPDQLAALLRDGEIATKKGPIFQTAILAGVMGAKKTSELIPLCHPLPLSSVNVELLPTATGYTIEATARTTAQTGVEMEALTAVAVAALTIYDMVKAVDQRMVIGDIKLMKKSGGKSGTFVR